MNTAAIASPEFRSSEKPVLATSPTSASADAVLTEVLLGSLPKEARQLVRAFAADVSDFRTEHVVNEGRCVPVAGFMDYHHFATGETCLPKDQAAALPVMIAICEQRGFGLSYCRGSIGSLGGAYGTAAMTWVHLPGASAPLGSRQLFDPKLGLRAVLGPNEHAGTQPFTLLQDGIRPS